MEERNKNIPKRRFKEFENAPAWEQREFFDNIEKTIDFRGRTPRKIGLEWSESGYLALSALNVKDGYIDYSAEAHYGDEELYIKWMQGNELKKGQVLFTTEAPMGNVTQIPDNKKYILSQRTIAFVTKTEKINDSFLAVLLKSSEVYNNLLSFSSGGTAKGVSQRSLKTLEVKVPIDIKEQEKIGVFFKGLNETITLHQRKLDKLKNLKESYLSEMFPTEGQRKPKRRLADFTDDWEQREFLGLVNKLSKTSISENLPKIEFEDIISGEGRLNKDVSAKFDNRKGILFNENNILYGKLRPYLKNWLYTDFKGVALGDFWVFEAKNIEPKFLYFLIQADIYQKAANDTSGTKMPRSDWQKVSSTKFYIPRDLEEQIKIGNLLWEIEETLTLHQRKIDKLKNMKEAYLTEMFV